MRSALAALTVILALFCCGCGDVPRTVRTAPKIIEAGGVQYTACEGFITVYRPSRDVADSSRETYEITFSDEYGKERDLKGLSGYTIREPGTSQALSYAMPPEANPSNTARTYSNGRPLSVGDVVTFGNAGSRARWNGPGQWEPVPCKGAWR